MSVPLRHTIHTYMQGSDWFRLVFGCFFWLRFLVFFLSFLVPFALYLQQFGTRICHFAWYLLHFGMVTLHFAWHLLHFGMVTLHFAWYLLHFWHGSTFILHGICYILALQPSCGFLESFAFILHSIWFDTSFGTSGFHLGSFKVS